MKTVIFVAGLLAVCVVMTVMLSCRQESVDMRRKDWLVVDVRTPEEFQSGHIKGAVNIPYDVIAERIGSVATNKDAPILLYCRSGRRSGIAKTTLEKEGYTQITNAGSYDALKRKSEGF